MLRMRHTFRVDENERFVQANYEQKYFINSIHWEFNISTTRTKLSTKPSNTHFSNCY